MKTPLLHNHRGGRPFRPIFATAALLLGGALMAQAQQFNSPAGSWDFVLSGSGQQGIAFITFVQDSDAGGTFTGYQVISAPQYPPSGGDGRNPGGDTGRGSSTSTNNTVGMNVYGLTGISGPWEFDMKGRVQGFFYQVVNASQTTLDWLGTCVTGFVPYTMVQTNGTIVTNATTVMPLSFCLSSTNSATNITWSSLSDDGTTNEYLAQFNVTSSNALVNLLYTDVGPAGITNSSTNITVPLETNLQPLSVSVTWVNAALSGTNTTNTSSFTFTPNFTEGVGNGTATNAISFIGTVVPGKRFNLVSTPSVSNGKVNYRGVPYSTALPDLTGNWSATKREGGKSYLEFFKLTSVTQLGANFFTTNGFGFFLGSAITNYPSIYYGEGMGPGYSLELFTLLSSRKAIGFDILTIPDGTLTNSVMSATYGPFTRTAMGGRATTRGMEEPGNTVLINATLFNAP